MTSIDGGLPVAAALTAGLTPLPGGDREAADTGVQAAGEASLPGGPDSPPVAFDVAAVLCGHNISSETGKANARSDYKVWDLVERMRP